MGDQFWPRDYEDALPMWRDAFRGPHAVNPSQTAIEHQKELLYDPDKFNLAVHFRHGDITPTNKSYFRKLLANVLGKFADLLGPPEHARRLPVVFWIFSEDLAIIVADLEQMPEALAGLVEIRSDTSEISMLLAFSHWLAADVFVSSDSSISWAASFLAGDGTSPGMPIAIAPPTSKRHGSSGFRDFAEGNIVADIEGEFEDARGALRNRAETRLHEILACPESNFGAKVQWSDPKRVQKHDEKREKKAFT